MTNEKETKSPPEGGSEQPQNEEKRYLVKTDWPHHRFVGGDSFPDVTLEGTLLTEAQMSAAREAANLVPGFSLTVTEV